MVWLIIAIAVAGTLGSFTDWLFMGLLFHEAYNRHPEIWRSGIRDGGDQRAIVWSSVLGYLITASVAGLCLIAHAKGLGVGAAVGLLASIPVSVAIAVNGLFIKLDAKITAAHCLGYSARNLLAGAAAGLALGLHG